MPLRLDAMPDREPYVSRCMLCWGARRQAALQLQRQLQEAQAAKLKLEQELTSQQFTVQVQT